jgi:predicted NACHT family NTPase
MRLDGRGYLADPDAEFGKYSNPDLVTIDKLTDVPCLVLLGEPGIGKSQEMTDLADHSANERSHSFVKLNLRSCPNLVSELLQEPDFVAWMDGEERLYLFLDSLDEGLLEARNLATQIVDEFRKRKYRDKIDRLYLRIACRTAVFPQVLEEGLSEIWEKENTSFYELAPLRQVDVEVAANQNGVDVQAFLDEIDRKRIASFAIKPITLKFLINRFKNHNGHFPDEQSLADIYLDGCRALCEESNPSRRIESI